MYQVLRDAFPGAELEHPRTFLSENAVMRHYEADEWSRSRGGAAGDRLHAEWHGACVRAVRE